MTSEPLSSLTPHHFPFRCSPIKQFKRLAALRKLDAGSRTKLGFKAQAACYCPASKQLVLLDNGLNLYFWSPDTGTTVMKRMVNADVDQAAEKPLLAVCGTGRAIAGGSDGTLQASCSQLITGQACGCLWHAQVQNYLSQNTSIQAAGCTRSAAPGH